MADNFDTFRGREGFPTDRPLDALTDDHNLIRQLFENYLETEQEEDERQDAGRDILLHLDRHMALEEGVFYPRVREVDAELVDRCDAEHQQAKELMEQIRGLEEGATKTRAFRKLYQAIMAHVETEEMRLFPRIAQSGLDLQDIGADMQAFELSMIAAEAPAARRPEMRP
jgi:hemerythrin superfamily protein